MNCRRALAEISHRCFALKRNRPSLLCSALLANLSLVNGQWINALDTVVKKILCQSDAAEFLVAFAGIQETVHQVEQQDYTAHKSKLEADLARRAEHYFSDNMRVIKDTLQSDEASSSVQSNKRGSTRADYKKVRKEMAGHR
ncbi:hypothetical protein Ccrd_017148 [Cynara cardunculus var. scolymus]|uniref:Uncharacterized protein n=1 Tax=Cynara cardunculus var. scolymus TaxID=59895 RepID=A0A103Y8M6_CYNCS|nr:hypothetical protein Ccrd_017148 [Cynara cardunculus var. scolymus]